MMARQVIYGPDDGDDGSYEGGYDRDREGRAAGRRYSVTEEDILLRPTRMAEMVGQREVYERILIAIEAAKKRGEPLGHILFDGPPGLGKTTFATCIPRELGTTFQIANGATLKAPKDIIPYLTNAEEGSVLFIDEIHRMQKSVEEFIYPAMEDFRIDYTYGDGANARTLNIPLKHFTLIGATTRTGLLSAPMRDRFQMREHLDFYTPDELATIVLNNAAKRLRWVRDYADARANGKVSPQVALAAMEMQGIDALGLDPFDRRFLETICRVFNGGPVGVEAVAHTMNIAPDTLVDEVEPFLLRSELLIRTPRGRKVTAKGFEHLGIDPSQFDFPQTLF